MKTGIKKNGKFEQNMRKKNEKKKNGNFFNKNLNKVRKNRSHRKCYRSCFRMNELHNIENI